MAEKDEKQEAVARLIPPELTGEDRPLYSNYVAVNHTPWDFALHFGTVTAPITPKPTSAGGLEIPVKKLLSVNIPVLLIKGLIKALQTNVEIYEKQYGEIRIPKEGKPPKEDK